MASKNSCQFCQLDFKSRAFGLQYPQTNCTYHMLITIIRYNNNKYIYFFSLYSVESIYPPTENQDVNDDDESEEDQAVNDDEESEEDQDVNDDQECEEHRDIDDAILKYRCKKCEYRFKFKSMYFRHKATHVPGSFVCDYCTKVFKKKDLLKDHILIHIERENFKSNMCNKKYSIKRDLNIHRRLKHNDSN